jgi:hypothetical protein
LSKQVWRRVHFASFVLFIVATIHGLAAGADTKSAMAEIVAGVVGSVFIGLTTARIVESTRTPAPTPRQAVVRQQLTTNR